MRRDKIFRVKIQGSSPLIMHSCDGINPHNPWSKKLKPLMGKRDKTDEDHKEISDLQFCQSLYWSKELNGLYIPADNVRKMLFEAAKKTTKGKGKGQIIEINYETPIGWPLQVKNRDDIETLLSDPTNKYVKIVTIQKNKVPHTRAIFNEWSFEMELTASMDTVSADLIEQWFEVAGQKVGLGSRRPAGPTPGQYGRFIVTEFKEVK